MSWLSGLSWRGLKPSHATILLFFSIIAIGTLLLMLPIAQKKPLSLIDALFTATSATCVTGLLTVNVAETFTLFGQTVIMMLIQVGGLGIIMVSTLFMILLGRAVSVRDSSMVYDTFVTTHGIKFKKLLGSILLLVFVFEAAGAVVMTWFWYDEFGFFKALFTGVFHSISAFCNAGISTLPNGLIGFDKKPAMDIVFLVLIVSGVIGFMAFREFYERIRYRAHGRRIWSLQIRLILLYTLVLIVAGTVGFIFFEYDNTLTGKPFFEKVLSGLFHSVSGRTAGFSNATVSEFNNTTLYMFILLMFIGGAPASVAGGIKITTFAILIGLAVSSYKGYERVHIFNHAVPEEIVSRSISIVFISFAVVTVFLFLLLITELEHPGAGPESHGRFLHILFETVSANGTVGLSMGITSSLSAAGKLLITLLMFIGRLGPLAIAMAVGSRRKGADYQLSEEAVMVG